MLVHTETGLTELVVPITSRQTGERTVILMREAMNSLMDQVNELWPKEPQS